MDWISFKFEDLDSTVKRQIVDYLFEFQFNLYEKTDYGINNSAKSIRVNKNYPFDVYYSEKIIGSNENLNKFFLSCKQKLTQFNINIKYEQNDRGRILRIGNRRSNRYSRIYEKSNYLRFEYEIKGSVLNSFAPLFKTDLNEFEAKITREALNYFAKKLPLNSKYTLWLVKKLRPFRIKSQSSLQFKTDYINVNQLHYGQEDKDLITFLRFLMFAEKLDYTVEYFGDVYYRCVYFKLDDFLDFLEPNRRITYYRTNKLKEFISKLQTKFLIQKFTDQYFQSLMAVPQIKITKQSKTLIAKVWIVEELFYYNYPFSLPDLFNSNSNSKLNKHRLSVLIEIISRFTFVSLEKTFNMKEFLSSYSTLSNRDIRLIKGYFIEYIELLVKYGAIEDKFYTLKNGIAYETDTLTTRNINEGFIIREVINFDVN